jgi:hypothetical protein
VFLSGEEGVSSGDAEEEEDGGGAEGFSFRL